MAFAGSVCQCLPIRVRPRFFDQVGHETMYASSRHKHFSLNLVIVKTNQNYEQKIFFDKSWSPSQRFFIEIFFGKIRPIFNTKK